MAAKTMIRRSMVSASARIIALCGIIACPLANGQTPTPEPEPLTIQWRERPGNTKVGRAAAYSGEVDEKGIDFAMPGNVVFGRSGIHLTGEPGKPLHLEVRNQLSPGWDRQLETDATGVAKLEFRTEGEALVRIRSASGKAPYQVMFFAGRELPIHRNMPNTIVPMSVYRETMGEPRAARPETVAATSPAAEKTPPVLWIIAALLAALVVLLAIFLFRKKTSSAP